MADDPKKFRFCELPGADGKVAFSLFGKGKRKAFFFHGYPGSRHQASFLAPHLTAEGIELASFDRPGFGHSSPVKLSGARLDLSQVISALAEHLGWKKYHLLAVSGGAPYALRTATELRNQVESVQIVCGLGPITEPAFRKHFPKVLLHAMRLGTFLPRPLLNALLSTGLLSLSVPRKTAKRPAFLSPADFALLHSPEVRPQLEESLEAAFRQGVGGAQTDLKAYLSDWDLDFEKLTFPVSYWHGKDDRLVPWQFSKMLAKRTPGARLIALKKEGHYTLPIGRAREILKGIP